jgi:hypothetical protein
VVILDTSSGTKVSLNWLAKFNGGDRVNKKKFLKIEMKNKILV